MKKIVIFDLDGTTLNTIEDLTAACNYALAQFGTAPITKDDVLASMGDGLFNLMMRLSKLTKKEDLMKLGGYFVEYYKNHLFDHTMPFPGMLELLKELKEKGIQTYILSNKDDFAVKLMSEYYFGYLIDDALGYLDGGAIKPDPICMQTLLERNSIEVNKEDILYIGDSYTDYLTAVNFGVDFVLCRYGFGPFGDLDQKVNEVNNPSELKQFIL